MCIAVVVLAACFHASPLCSQFTKESNTFLYGDQNFCGVAWWKFPFFFNEENLTFQSKVFVISAEFVTEPGKEFHVFHSHFSTSTTELLVFSEQRSCWFLHFAEKFSVVSQEKISTKVGVQVMTVWTSTSRLIQREIIHRIFRKSVEAIVQTGLFEF